MKTLDLDFVRGNTFQFISEIEGLSESIDSAYFSVKEKVEDTEYIFQKTLEDGITINSDGSLYVRIAPEDTEDMTVNKKYKYDLEITVGNDVYTLSIGNLMLQADITR